MHPWDFFLCLYACEYCAVYIPKENKKHQPRHNSHSTLSTINPFKNSFRKRRPPPMGGFITFYLLQRENTWESTSSHHKRCVVCTHLKPLFNKHCNLVNKNQHQFTALSQNSCRGNFNFYLKMCCTVVSMLAVSKYPFYLHKLAKSFTDLSSF